jgi:hypothetical protein
MTDDASLTALRHRLTEVRDSMGEVRMTVPDGAIFASARKHRTQRRVAAGLTAACAAIALALALVLVLPGSQARAVHVHLAAWSVDTSGNGTVSVTVHELTHPALLARVLGEAGVPAVVAFNAGCLTPHNQGALARSGALRTGRAGVVIHPSAIPGHARMLFSVLAISAKYGQPVSGFGWGLVGDRPLHCSSALHDARYYYSGPAR